MLFFPLFIFAIKAEIAPDIPAGTNATFQQMCQTVQAEIAPFDFKRAPDFKKAEKDILALPSLQVSIEWNDTGVPSLRKAEFLRAREAAIATWQKVIPALRA